MWACRRDLREVPGGPDRGERAGRPTSTQLVYDAERPELFFKSVAWRVSGPGAAIGVRADSTLDVPGAGAGRWWSTRAARSSATPSATTSSSRQHRGREPALPAAGQGLLRRLRVSGPGSRRPGRSPTRTRSPSQLTHRPRRRDRLGGPGEHRAAAPAHRRPGRLPVPRRRSPGRRVLSTGTCLVPELPFSLQDGDIVTIDDRRHRHAQQPGRARLRPGPVSPGPPRWTPS